MNNQRVSATLFTALAFTGIALAAGDAAASGVIVCNNCNSVAQAAKQGGDGLVIVTDFPNKKIWGFRNEYDRETGQFFPRPVSIPASIVDSHNNTMTMTDPAKAQITIRQNDPGSNAFPFPAGFEGWNAHHIATDTNMRGQFAHALAAHYTGATTSSNLWNNLTVSLKSLALGWLGTTGRFEFVTVTVFWSDGSRTVMTIDKDDVTTMDYVPGQSFDSEGNRIPDYSIGRGSGDEYVGNYQFSNEDGLNEWLYAASQYGIPITGTRSKRMSCSWDGRTLSCHYY
ncbi:hypothetical protein [Marilutibacter chinensis]|uniref:Secreted protein n=1 Tax=Marilutibacter chinensis TaxID=2912247 RepID=A0ABS9HYI0_9GAMM|nr:hypothetical protein [Lysobacter chinensis]MCF7223808.1 hypothetical protein [Lysobacter chinensis]